MSIRAVSLDLFDTLVDLRVDLSRGAYPTAWALHRAVAEHSDVAFDAFLEQFREADRELRNARYAEGIELPSLERFRHLAGRLKIADPGLPERLTRIHMAMILQSVATPAHHLAVVRALRRRVRVGVCSNFTHTPTALRILQEGGIAGEFDAIVVSDEVGLRKPRREIFEAAIARLESSAEDTLHVGDDLRTDVAGAAGLGMRTAWITRRFENPEEQLGRYDGPRPDWIVADLAELEALLDGA